MTVWEAAAAASAFLLRSGPNDDWQEVTPGERIKIHASSDQTGGAFSMVEAFAEPGNGVPMHIHHNEDEHFIVLEGTFHVAVGNKSRDLSAGETITAPKGVPTPGATRRRLRCACSPCFHRPASKGCSARLLLRAILRKSRRSRSAMARRSSARHCR